MKCLRIGAESNTPSREATVSQMKVCSWVGLVVKWTILEARSISKVARIPHMKAVWAAEVPAVWTMLFCQRS